MVEENIFSKWFSIKHYLFYTVKFLVQMDVRQRYIDEKFYNWNSVFCFTPRISNVPESVEDNGVSAKNFTIENSFRRDKQQKISNFNEKTSQKICIF